MVGHLFALMSRTISLLVILSLLAGQPVYAQGGVSAEPEDPQATTVPAPTGPPQAKNHSAAGGFLLDVWTDQKAIWSSPARIRRKQFFTIVLPLTAATAALITTDEEAGKLLPNTPDQVLWCNRVSKMGAAYTLGGLIGGAIVVGGVKHEPELLKMGRLSAEAFANSFIVNYAIKGMTARERPDQNDGQGRFWKGGQSFPSGHAMNSFAVATAVARSPACPKWLAITSYSVATIVSLSRWGARKHFPSDILVGGVLGGLIGNYVATRPRP